MTDDPSNTQDSQVSGASRTTWMASRAPTYAPPGTLTVEPTAHLPSMRVIAYGPEKFIDHPISDPGKIKEYLHVLPVTWVNVDGLGDADTIAAIGDIFGLHNLALEDVVHVGQRAKVDDYDHYLFIVARMVDRLDGQLGTEQLSMIVGKDYVVTFQERPGDCLDAIRQRAREKRGHVRDAGADYLAYAILDAVMDEYFPVLEAEGDRLERLETRVLECPGRRTIAHIHDIKRDLLVLRRAMWPMREAVSAFYRSTSSLVRSETRPYLRDCYDHTIQILDLIEIYRELGTGLVEMYMTSVSYRMNEVIKVLTIISTIFMPLTFVAGVYGMNFDRIPEFHWRWGYPFALAIMVAVTLVMLYYFWRKGWLFASPDDRRRRPTRRRERH